MHVVKSEEDRERQRQQKTEQERLRKTYAHGVELKVQFDVVYGFFSFLKF